MLKKVQRARSRTSAVAGVLGALALVTTACGSTPSAAPPGGGTAVGAGTGTGGSAPAALIKAAKKEGKLVFYGSLPDGPMQVAASGFERAYGIKTSYVRLTSADLDQRVEAEAAAGSVKADVIIDAEGVFMSDGVTKGYTIPLDPKVMPSLAAVPKQYKFNANTVVMGFGFSIAVYNTNLVKNPPTTWQDLLKPQFKGKIYISDPRVSASYLALWDDVYNDSNLGPKFISSFAKQDYKLAPSGVEGVQLVAAGQAPIYFTVVPSVPEPLMAQGAPIKYWYFKDPGAQTEEFAAISKNSPDPKAAELFVNWLMSKSGQELVNKAAYFASPLGNLPGMQKIPTGVVVQNDKNAQENQGEILKLLGISSS